MRMEKKMNRMTRGVLFAAVVTIVALLGAIYNLTGEIKRLRATVEVGPTHMYTLETGEYTLVDYAVLMDGKLKTMSCGIEDKSVLDGHRLLDVNGRVVGRVTFHIPIQ